MRKRFLEFVQNKSGSNNKPKHAIMDEAEAVTSKITLGDGNNFPPFVVSDDANSQFYGKNSALAPLIRAFKKGGNWGWSKDESGEEKPIKMGSKKLFLTGGALRDHLMGKKSKDIEVVTNSSPDEIYHILVQNGFKYLGDKKAANQAPQGQKTFYVDKQDERGRPYSFLVNVKNTEIELSTFKKTKNGESGSHSDDASSRDFTINAMYLLLSNDNGPNKELFDFYGGMRHLLDGRIASVGNLERKLKEDPIRALRYARMLARYGNPRKVPEEEREALRKSVELIHQLKPEDVMGEFLKGMNYEDIDPRLYLKIYNHLGLLDGLFPGMNLDTKFPKELRELGDRFAPIAWMLRIHQPEEIKSKLGNMWRPQDLNKVIFLIKSIQKLDDNMDEDSLQDLVQSYHQSGVSGRKLKFWASKLGGKSEQLVDAFLQHANSPRIRVFVGGNTQPTDAFADLVDPFSGLINNESAETRKKVMEWENFQRLLKSI